MEFLKYKQTFDILKSIISINSSCEKNIEHNTDIHILSHINKNRDRVFAKNYQQPPDETPLQNIIARCFQQFYSKYNKEYKVITVDIKEAFSSFRYENLDKELQQKYKQRTLTFNNISYTLTHGLIISQDDRNIFINFMKKIIEKIRPFCVHIDFYVDDIYLITKDQLIIQKIKQILQNHYLQLNENKIIISDEITDFLQQKKYTATFEMNVYQTLGYQQFLANDQINKLPQSIILTNAAKYNYYLSNELYYIDDCMTRNMYCELHDLYYDNDSDVQTHRSYFYGLTIQMLLVYHSKTIPHRLLQSIIPTYQPKTGYTLAMYCVEYQEPIPQQAHYAGLFFNNYGDDIIMLCFKHNYEIEDWMPITKNYISNKHGHNYILYCILYGVKEIDKYVHLYDLNYLRYSLFKDSLSLHQLCMDYNYPQQNWMICRNMPNSKKYEKLTKKKQLYMFPEIQYVYFDNIELSRNLAIQNRKYKDKIQILFQKLQILIDLLIFDY